MVLVDDPADATAEGVPGLPDQSGSRVLLATLLELARQVPRVGRVLLFHPPEAEARLARWALGFRLWPQLGATPGERYANAFRQAPELGYDGAVVIGLGPLPPTADLVIEAAGLLAEHHGAIMRDTSGGIALLALQEPQPTILSRPTRPRYDDIITRARQQRVRLVELAPPGELDHDGLAASRAPRQ